MKTTSVPQHKPPQKNAEWLFPLNDIELPILHNWDQLREMMEICLVDRPSECGSIWIVVEKWCLAAKKTVSLVSVSLSLSLTPTILSLYLTLSPRPLDIYSFSSAFSIVMKVKTNYTQVTQDIEHPNNGLEIRPPTNLPHGNELLASRVDLES